jgi:hypothetical protein
MRPAPPRLASVGRINGVQELPVPSEFNVSVGLGRGRPIAGGVVTLSTGPAKDLVGSVVWFVGLFAPAVRGKSQPPLLPISDLAQPLRAAIG